MHWMIAPVIVPAIVGPLIVLLMRHDLIQQRVFSVAATVTQLVIAVMLMRLAMGGEVLVYRLGNWPAPFGIVLMFDRLAALMLVLSAVLALAVQLYAIGSGWDRKGWHFHALWQFQMMGLNGAFLTGDAFNLFVFFEVLLIASYGLMIHGGGAMRLRAGVQYIAYNLAGSTLFLAALGALYAATGTLNMADMAARVAAMPDGGGALLRAGAIMLMLVFAVKAALVPLHFWLPATYANAPGPVAALFAIMTKVGVYATIRFFTLVFPPETDISRLAVDFLLPAALVTLALGQIGVLGTRHLGRLAAFAALASIGTLMIGVAQATLSGLAAALWYLVHSTLAAGALFLVVDLIGARRRDLWLTAQPPITQAGLVGALFMAAAIGVAGLPPLSGFLGKIAILQTAGDGRWAVAVWAVILTTSLLAIVGLARAGSLLFWRAAALGPQPAAPGHAAVAAGPLPAKVEPDEPVQDISDASAPTLALASAGGLIGALAVLTVLAGPMMDYAQATALQLGERAAYYEAVMLRQEGSR